MNNWKIRPYSGNHTLNVEGNIYSEDGSSPYTNALGSYNVMLINSVSNLINIVDSTGGSSYTPYQIAQATWNFNTTETAFTTDGTIASFIKNKILTVSKFIGLQ